MSEKKNIDRLFREKFKDFEVAPPDYVWENIRETLQEKNKRRVVPLWIRLSGVAAILVVGFLFVTPYLEEADTDSNPVVIENAAKGQNPQEQDPLATPATQPGANQGAEIARIPAVSVYLVLEHRLKACLE